MFEKCSSLTSLNLNNLNTSEVEIFAEMFRGCSSLKYLDISNLDLSKARSINDMFVGFDYSNLTVCINENNAGELATVLTNFSKYCYPNEYNENEEQNEQISVDLFNNDYILEDIDDIEKYIEEEIINGNLDKLINQLINNEREELIIIYKNKKYEITTTNNNYNEYKNISIIKLGNCEERLKKYNNISINETLIIFKIDTYQKGKLTPKVKYEIYDMKNKN